LFFQPWQRWASGVDLRIDRIVYDRAYSFDRPSPWSEQKVDVSHLISLKAFAGTYAALPAGLRNDVETILRPVRAAPKPLVLLLLFGLGSGSELSDLYRKSLSRIFAERASELEGCSLAVKVHPGARGTEERVLVDWLKMNVPATVHVIDHALNLEFMLPQLQPDYVLAGLCGALPIVRHLRAGRPIALAELMEAFFTEHPGEREVMLKFLDGIEIW
jgi:hypothetical protein